jgi:uncharacterized protein YlaN (UPF0358 family)
MLPYGLAMLQQGSRQMELLIKLDIDDARVLRLLLHKMADLTWPPQCDVYHRISDKLVVAEEEAGFSTRDHRAGITAE